MRFVPFQLCFTDLQRPHHRILEAFKEIRGLGGLFFFLHQQGPKAEKTKRVLNLSQAAACVCTDLDRALTDSTSKKILSKMMLQALCFAFRE